MSSALLILLRRFTPACTEFVPYVFQIFAQLLELHQGAIPNDYRALLPFLLQSSSWQQKGTIPGLVRLLKAFLKRNGSEIAATGDYTKVLGIIQSVLIPYKTKDGWGFELLQSVLQYIPSSVVSF